MFIDLKKRARNVVFWLGLIALLTFISGDFGFNLGKYSGVINHGLQLLMFLGILNNPISDSKGLGDDLPVSPVQPELKPIGVVIPETIPQITPADPGQPVNPNAPPQ